MEQLREHSGIAVDLELADRIGDAGGMAECDDFAGVGMADFIDARADGRLDQLAIMRVRKSLPTCPGLHL